MINVFQLVFGVIFAAVGIFFVVRRVQLAALNARLIRSFFGNSAARMAALYQPVGMAVGGGLLLVLGIVAIVQSLRL